ncbi:hypothetical protein CRENBAI_018153 [Crenichthys baileyi]|uniref:Uncharacterized protein n=1 Tax=Crenichthys baileyi TaxID=28760 RepID=A0AAV9R523_9TELE
MDQVRRLEKEFKREEVIARLAPCNFSQLTMEDIGDRNPMGGERGKSNGGNPSFSSLLPRPPRGLAQGFGLALHPRLATVSLPDPDPVPGPVLEVSERSVSELPSYSIPSGPVLEGSRDKPPSLPVPALEGFGDGLPPLPVPVLEELKAELPPCPISSERSRMKPCRSCSERVEGENPNLFLFPPQGGSATDLHGLAMGPSGFCTPRQSSTVVSSLLSSTVVPGLEGSTAGFLVANILISCSEGPLHIWAGVLTSLVVGSPGPATSLWISCFFITGLRTAFSLVADCPNSGSGWVDLRAIRLNSGFRMGQPSGRLTELCFVSGPGLAQACYMSNSLEEK